MKIFYRRHLPHYQPPGGTFFITFRLFGSLPIHIIDRLSREYRQLRIKYSSHTYERNPEDFHYYKHLELLFLKLDKILDNNKDGPHYLKNPLIADQVKSTLHYWDNKKYELQCFCIMSNHVHLVLTPLEISENNFFSISNIMHSIKSYTANQSNKILNRKGEPFWEIESFDHFVRNNDELFKIIYYVLNNPVKLGLVSNWTDWRWSYLAPKLADFLWSSKDA